MVWWVNGWLYLLLVVINGFDAAGAGRDHPACHNNYLSRAELSSSNQPMLCLTPAVSDAGSWLNWTSRDDKSPQHHGSSHDRAKENFYVPQTRPLGLNIVCVVQWKHASCSMILGWQSNKERGIHTHLPCPCQHNIEFHTMSHGSMNKSVQTLPPWLEFHFEVFLTCVKKLFSNDHGDVWRFSL